MVTRKNIKDIILPILKRQGVEKAALFGSFARGDTKKKSDIDILVKFRGKKSLFELGGLKVDLEEALKKKVDIIEYSSIHPLLKDRILNEQIPIL
ncbi:MAG: hypothetical protein A3I88_03325 [Candidatus Portnoybacteria bacterium RIFCSPLOWO2_12_FULL_39_9]|nr:MAG: hypothetical protein A2646_03150 [Candidatus Portnoybacteria bacterium RIFCSPHIGHO2_02_FULL_39_12]OGZ40638.1 MAG: hypothetical protein A3I88_03325 [Candidatus Portnoybacteria bacterium RIFCSPLOWO2_12_FULL_39_9]